ncbi:MAG: hypothetical protein AB1546_03135 [bacterium]
MQEISDIFDQIIRLTNERLNHILEHPEMVGNIDKIEETLKEP